ncbi:phosphate/phosphite/phosphonate ABC transporter substrate-binding protein [Arenimonas daejeonensis]|uniref:phosphate/phosphite/phosphonate ABC transporter substrate-binding protein n=1 Tax=Arenimonas daejeonensis TaxID=370777 RepID=UPI0011BE8166|nr:PhnD/SsuA/transferrin family substrate-binding protein [Arenimonas daejeonensis]
MKLSQGLAALVFSLLAAPSMAADYTLAVEPNYPPAQAQQVYKPLLDYLSRSTGHRFILKTATNYHVYWRDLRSNAKTDFAFEEAHFTDYRIDRLGFTPLVRVAEATRYTLLADAPVAEGGVPGLIGYRVVSMPAPSLGYLLLGELYKNPIAQPEIQSVASNWRDGVEMVFAQESEAAMVPNYIAQLYPNLVAVSESREFTGRALSAGGTVPADVRAAVSEAMLKLHQDDALYEVLVELGASQFVVATAEEYAGNESLLRGVFGYKAKPASATPEPEPEPETDEALDDEEITGGIEVQADN